MPERKSPPEVAEILKTQTRDLERLIQDAQRVQREIKEHLSKLRRAGEPSAQQKQR